MSEAAEVRDFLRGREGVIWTRPHNLLFRVEGSNTYWIYPVTKTWSVGLSKKRKRYRYKAIEDWFSRYYEAPPDRPCVVAEQGYLRVWANDTWNKCKGPITLNDIERMQVIRAVEGASKKPLQSVSK